MWIQTHIHFLRFSNISIFIYFIYLFISLLVFIFTKQFSSFAFTYLFLFILSFIFLLIFMALCESSEKVQTAHRGRKHHQQNSRSACFVSRSVCGDGLTRLRPGTHVTAFSRGSEMLSSPV